MDIVNPRTVRHMLFNLANKRCKDLADESTNKPLGAQKQSRNPRATLHGPPFKQLYALGNADHFRCPNELLELDNKVRLDSIRTWPKHKEWSEDVLTQSMVPYHSILQNSAELHLGLSVGADIWPGYTSQGQRKVDIGWLWESSLHSFVEYKNPLAANANELQLFPLAGGPKLWSVEQIPLQQNQISHVGQVRLLSVASVDAHELTI